MASVSNWVGVQIRKVGNIVFASLLTLFVGTFLGLLWLINEFVRRLIITPLLLICYGDRMKLVTDGADNVWSFRKFGNSRNILVLLVYKNQIDPDQYRQNFMSSVIDYRGENGERPFHKLKHIYSKKFGYHCWERNEDGFDINNHVVVLDASWKSTREGNGKDFFVQNEIPSSPWPIYTETNVLRVLRDLTLDMGGDKPQWQEVIIPNFVYDNDVEESFDGVSKQKVLRLKPEHKIRSARIFRCHHAYMDGASVMLITSSCMMDGKFPYSADMLAPSKRTQWDKFSLVFRSIFFGVQTLLKTVMVAATARNRFVTREFQGVSHHVWSPRIPLSTITEIRTLAKSSFTAILASVTATAARKFEEKYPEVKNMDKKSPISCCSCDFHGQEENEDCNKIATKGGCGNKPSDRLLIGMTGAVGPYPNVGPRNRYTVVNFHANNSPNKTRLERLESMTRKITRMAKSEDFLVNLWLFQFFGKFPAFFVQNMMKNGGSPIIVSNTPWAKSPVSLLGDEVDELGGWVPLLAFSGVGILITRYCDTLRFCGVAEEACLSEEHLKFIINEIQNDIKLLSEECAKMKKNSGMYAIDLSDPQPNQ